MLPKSFFPCFAPLPRVSVVGTPSSNSRAWLGKLKSTQWTQVPRGASGSSQMRARLLVPSGGSDHFNGGDRSSPSPVYCLGMVAPGWKAVLVTSMDMEEPPDCVSFEGRLHPKPRMRQGESQHQQDGQPPHNKPTYSSDSVLATATTTPHRHLLPAPLPLPQQRRTGA